MLPRPLILFCHSQLDSFQPAHIVYEVWAQNNVVLPSTASPVLNRAEDWLPDSQVMFQYARDLQDKSTLLTCIWPLSVLLSRSNVPLGKLYWRTAYCNHSFCLWDSKKMKGPSMLWLLWGGGCWLISRLVFFTTRKRKTEQRRKDLHPIQHLDSNY